MAPQRLRTTSAVWRRRRQLATFITAIAATFAVIDLKNTVQAHISLTYPPARSIDSDFLGSNKSLSGPCGVSRGRSPSIKLQEGSTFNITWNFDSTNKAGFGIELLDSNYSLVHTLTHPNELIGSSEREFQITLPAHFTCEKCVIRLTRHDEHSCADVDIVRQLTNADRMAKAIEQHPFLAPQPAAGGSTSFFGDSNEPAMQEDSAPASLQLVGRAADVPLDRIYQCRGEFKDPVGCDTFDCQYIAKWQFIPEHDSVWFMIQTKNDGRWHGIGFSDDRRMPNTDVIIMWLRGSQLRVSDMWLSDYAPPTPNDHPAIMNVTAKLVGGMLKIEFVRPRLTIDKHMDFQMTDDHCPYFVFPTTGGEIDPVAGVIRKHNSTPLVSEQRICVTTCEKAQEMVQLQVEAAKAADSSNNNNAGALANSNKPPSRAITVTRLNSGNGTSQTIIEQHTVDNNNNNNGPTTTLPTAAPTTTTTTTTTLAPLREGSHHDESVVRSCGGRWKYPTTCELDCDYVASWVYEPETDAVKFLIQTRHVNKWTGIGFSHDRRMPHSDVIYAMARPDGTVAVFDGYTETYAAPRLDHKQDIADAIGFVENDLLTVTFTRPRAVHDPRDISFLDQSNCPYLLFPVYGGNFDLNTGAIQKHEQTPYVSTSRICIVPCDTVVSSSLSPAFLSSSTGSGVFTTPGSLISGPATVTAQSASSSSSAPISTTQIINDMLDSMSTNTNLPASSSSSGTTTLLPPRERPSAVSPADAAASVAQQQSQYVGMPPVEGTRCRARFRFPDNCNGLDCLYVADWEYLPATDRVAFLLRSADVQRWTGIGFSAGRQYAADGNATDLVVAWVEPSTNRVSISDRNVKLGNPIPQRDLVQNLGNLGGKFDGPFQLIAFSKPRLSNGTEGIDPRDGQFQFTNQNCAHFVFPIMGGAYPAGGIDDERVGAPERAPYITERKICVGPCGIPGVDDSPFVPIPFNLPLISTTTTTTTAPLSAAAAPAKTEISIQTPGQQKVQIEIKRPTIIQNVSSSTTESTTSIATSSASSSEITAIPTSTVSSSSTAAEQAKLSGTLLRNDCAGVFAYPDDCQQDECQYQVEWQFDEETQTIRFLVNYDDPKTWFGIGFSQERRKGLPTSAVYAYVQPDGKVRLVSAHHENDMPAVRNARQFVLLEDGGVRNGRVFVQFVRPLTTPNPQDYQWSNGQCPYFYFPIRGGQFDAESGALSPTSTPYLVSGERMCMRPCAAGTFGGPNATTSTTTSTTTSKPAESIVIIIPPSTTAATTTTRTTEKTTTTTTTPRTTPTTTTTSTSTTTTTTTARPTTRSTTTTTTTTLAPSTPSTTVAETEADFAVDDTAPSSTSTRSTEAPNSNKIAAIVFPGLTPTSAAPVMYSTTPPPTSTSGSGRPSCVGLFKYPYTCNGPDCLYYAQWEAVEGAPQVRITLLSSAPQNWTAIGFSDTRYMPNTDIIYGWVDEQGQLELFDAFAEDHAPPVVDLQRDIVRQAGRRADGLTQITFVRNFITNDSRDYQITKTNCPYLVFPVISNVYDPETQQIAKHGATPLVSTERVCLASCYEEPSTVAKSDTDELEPTSTTLPPVVVPVTPETSSTVVVLPGLHLHDGDRKKIIEPLPPTPQPAIPTLPVSSTMAPVAPTKTTPGRAHMQDCEGEWRYPPNCSDEEGDCLYVAQWEYLDSRDGINFTIKAAHADMNTWTGIGFGDTKLMPDTDVILGWVYPNGRAVISDRHTELHNGAPLDTNGQSFSDASVRRDDRNFTTLNFIRPRRTESKIGEDFQFSDYHCPYLKFPVYGGAYMLENNNGAVNQIRGHPADRPPFVSSERVCIRSCRQDYPRSLGLKIRLVDEIWNDELRNPQSEMYAKMKEKILSQIRSIVGPRRGVADIKLRSLEQGSVIAVMDILLEPEEPQQVAASSSTNALRQPASTSAAAPYTLDVAQDVRNALHTEMEKTDGRLGTLRVDPEAVVIEPVRDVYEAKPALAPSDDIRTSTTFLPTTSSTESPEIVAAGNPSHTTSSGPSSSFLALVIVLPIIGLILLLILLAALYKFYRVYRHRKLRQTHRVTQEQAKAAGWVDYSAVGGNITGNGAHRNAGFDETLTFATAQSKPPSYRSHPPSDFIGGPHKNGGGSVMMMEQAQGAAPHQHHGGSHLNGHNNNLVAVQPNDIVLQQQLKERSTTVSSNNNNNNKPMTTTTTTTTTTASKQQAIAAAANNQYSTTPPSAFNNNNNQTLHSSSGSALDAASAGGGGGGSNPQDRNVTEFYFVPSQRRW